MDKQNSYRLLDGKSADVLQSVSDWLERVFKSGILAPNSLTGHDFNHHKLQITLSHSPNFS